MSVERREPPAWAKVVGVIVLGIVASFVLAIILGILFQLARYFWTL